jgi:hypothetical protein
VRNGQTVKKLGHAEMDSRIPAFLEPLQLSLNSKLNINFADVVGEPGGQGLEQML